MKAFPALLCALLLFRVPAFGQAASGWDAEVTSSVLVPVEVYVGDTAELRCAVSTRRLLMPEGIGSDSVAVEDGGSSGDCSLVRLELRRADGGYELSVFFIPWRPGALSLPELDLGVFPAVAELLSPGDALPLSLPQVTVASLSEKLREDELRPVEPPRLVPGTIYVVYAAIVLCILLLFLLVFLCVRFRAVSAFIGGLALRVRSSRNFRRAASALKKLRKIRSTDADFAEGIERLLRLYLEKRFAHPFHSVTASELALVFDGIFAGLLSGRQQEAVDEACAVLRRCDYIRYSPSAEMEPGERNAMCDNVLKLVTFFEREGR